MGMRLRWATTDAVLVIPTHTQSNLGLVESKERGLQPRRLVKVARFRSRQSSRVRCCKAQSKYSDSRRLAMAFGQRGRLD